MTNTKNISWEFLPFEALTNAQLYAILRARAEVFIVEQNCVFQDMDNIDSQSHHLIGWGAPNEVAAYLRVVAPGVKYDEVSIGRVITTAPYRGTGLGREMTKRGVEEASKLYAQHGLRISAQAYLEKFYNGFGFHTVSEPYDEDGIPHIEMLRPANK